MHDATNQHHHLWLLADAYLGTRMTRIDDALRATLPADRRDLSFDALREHERRARRLRARAAGSAVSTIVSSLRRAAARVRQAWIERAAIRHLQGMEHHLLADIGLSRSQIEPAVRGRYQPATAATPATTPEIAAPASRAGLPAANDDALDAAA